MRILTSYLIVFNLLTGITMSDDKTSTNQSKKFGNNIMTQVAVVVKDIEETAKAFADLLSVDVPEVVITDPLEKADTKFKGMPTEGRAKLAFFQLDNITIELIEPMGGPSTWQEFLDTKGEGLHHIAFNVKGMDEHIALLESKGMKLVQRGNFEGGSYSYVDCSAKLKVIIELLSFNN